MTKNRSNTGRSSSSSSSSGENNSSGNNSGGNNLSGNRNGGSTAVDRTQNIAALSNVSPAEAAFLSSLPAEEFNALIEECSDIARGM